MKQKINLNLKKYEGLLNVLLEKPPDKMINAANADISCKGVYLISLPDDSMPIYAGKTITKGLSGRIKDHLILDTKSDLNGHIRNVSCLPQDAGEYLVRWLRMDDDKERGYFEYFVISVLQPLLNRI